jgi:hypothetical protein
MIVVKKPEAALHFPPDRGRHHPIGRALLTDSGYVMFIITAGGRPVPRTESDRAGLYESMMADTGTYRIDEPSLMR